MIDLEQPPRPLDEPPRPPVGPDKKSFFTPKVLLIVASSCVMVVMFVLASEGGRRLTGTVSLPISSPPATVSTQLPYSVPTISPPAAQENYKFYINTDTVNIRTCPSISCAVIRQAYLNDEWTFPSYETVADMPEWVGLNLPGETIHKIGYIKSSFFSLGWTEVVSNKNLISPSPTPKTYYSVPTPSVQSAPAITSTPKPSVIPYVSAIVGDSINSAVHNEFHRLWDAYTNCVAKYDIERAPLELQQQQLWDETKQLVANNGGDEEFYLRIFRNNILFQQYNDLLNQSNLVGTNILIINNSESRECTPYANMALGKPLFSGTGDSSSILNIINSRYSRPTDTFNELNCTITQDFYSGAWVTRCDNMSCRTDTDMFGGFGTTCTQY